MNREILHRAKHHVSGEWLIGSYVKRLSKGELKHYIIPVDFDGCWSERAVIEETVGQYWRTVNEQKLFDGDVFRIASESGVVITKVVKYIEKEACFCIANVENLKDENWLSIWQIPNSEWWEYRDKKITIIGNIHDNPELLK